MNRLCVLCLSVVLFVPFSSAFAKEFPEAPANIKEAEALGLQRLSTEELKAFFPGVVKSKGTKGKHVLTYKPDGSVDRRGFHDTTGKWRIDEKNNAYCLAFTESPHKLGRTHASKENCFAVFRASDGTHFFDYDIENGTYSHVWRRASGNE
jgi:hypothetical protein